MFKKLRDATGKCLNNKLKTTQITMAKQGSMNTVGGHPFMTSTRRGEGVGLRWTHVDGGGSAPCGRPHRRLKLEPADVILSSSHAKKLAFFYQNFIFRQNTKSGNLSI